MTVPQIIYQSASCVPAALRDSELVKADCVASKIATHADKASYHQVITKSYFHHPGGRGE